MQDLPQTPKTGCAERKPGSKLLGLLFLITFLANVPVLSSRFVFIHDTVQKVAWFNYIYSHVFFFDELPKWNPLICYGIPYDLILSTMLPTDFMCMFFGWCLGITDAFLLFKLAMLLVQFIYVFGLFLLCRRCFSSSLVVLLVCLGAIFTNSWHMAQGVILSSVYMLPLVIYFVWRFVDGGSPTCLWTAAILELYSCLGILYVLPVHLLILVVFLVPFFARDRSLFLVFLRWRTYVHPLFFCLVACLCVIGPFIFGAIQGLAIIDPNRDSATGTATLSSFLNDARQPLVLLLAYFARGDSPNNDMALFTGVLPLAALGYALCRRKDIFFWACALVVLVLFWFSQGGWLACAMYYAFPLMNKCRYISHMFGLSKMFVLLMGGFGIDQLLHDLAGKRQPEADQLPLRWRRLMLLLLAACCVDVVCNLRGDDLTFPKFDQGWRGFDDTWPRALIGRFLLYAVLAGTVWFLCSRKTFSFGKPLLRVVGGLFCAAYLLDVGFFYLLVMKTAPFSSRDVGTLLDVRKLTYTAARGAALSDHAEKVRDLLLAQRGRAPSRANYVDNQLLMQTDPLTPLFQFQTMCSGVRDMFLARGVKAAREAPLELPPKEILAFFGASAAGWMGSPLTGGPFPATSALIAGNSPNDSFKRALGFAAKIRLVRQAKFAENYREARVLFSEAADPGETLILIGPRSGATDGDGRANVATSADPLPNVTFFSANRIVIAVKAGTPGWLYYADAFHAGWQATVKGRPVPVLQANVGFKAVAVEAGDSEVIFEFKNEARDWLRNIHCALAAILGLGLLAVMCVAPWLSAPPQSRADFAVAAEATASPNEGGIRAVRIWCGAVLITSLGCALWVGFGMNLFTLGIVLAVFVAVVCLLKTQHIHFSP